MSTHRPERFNLLTLPAAQRRVLTYLAREGPTDAQTLAQALNQEPAELQNALSALALQGVVTLEADGRVMPHLGRTRQRLLPARLWPALQAASRLYSTQEIVTLRTVVPILQFARAKLGEFTDHGPGHALRVKAFATQLGYLLGLTAREQHLLRAAALFHDVGNIIERARHHIVSQEAVEKLTANGQLPFSPSEAALIGLLCRWHRKEYDPTRCDQLSDAVIRTGLAASILRVADALDSDYHRADHSAKFREVIEFFYPEEMPFSDDLATILGIRICCTPTTQLQLFVQAQTVIEESYHIRALRKDVAETPLECTVQVIECGAQPLLSAPENPPCALLACPFDPHSLIMAALSRKHLRAAGYAVDLLIYPDTPDATAWLWREELAVRNPAAFAHLVVIGDRPDAVVTPALLEMAARWRRADVKITILNRHEANWARLPELLQLGVAVTLGGDWAYFWGDAVDEADFFWGRIAALCTRDPIQSTVGLTAEEQTVSQGLLKAIYDEIAASTRQSPRRDEGWAARAAPILKRIAEDDRRWFAARAAAFRRDFAALTTPTRREGKVLRFELVATSAPYLLFWALEAAIEAQGRTPDRGIVFETPYAVATWSDADQNEDAVELLAISHWREEEATPLRLLYPADLGPTPEGNESAIRVRVPAAQAERLVQALLAACNEV